MRTALIYNFLIEANLMASIAILLMILVRKFCRQKLGSRAIYAAWALVAVRLLCPLALPNPVIHEIRSAFAQDEAIRPIAGQIKVRFGDAVNRLYDRARISGMEGVVEETLHDLRDDAGNGMLSINLMKIYLVGAGLVIGWYVLSNVRFQKKLKADRVGAISEQVQETYLALCREMGIKRPVSVYCVDPLPSACLAGCFKPCIALPLTTRPEEMENVLRHELCHYKNGDHWWGLARLMCCALHWFNPLVWMAARMVRTDAELACDERVIAGMNQEQRQAYAGTLVMAACKRDMPGVGVLSTSMSMTGRRLKQRVVSIVSHQKAHRGMAIGFILLASVALAGAFCTAETPLIGKIPSGEMGVRSSVVAESTVKMTDEEKKAVIEQAKAFWQSEPLQANVHDKLEWSVQAFMNHVEVHAFDPEWGEALIVAFAPDGRILYMNNRRSGDREAILYNEARNMLSGENLNLVQEYALQTLEGMLPGISQEWDRLDPYGATRNNDQYFYRFFAYTGEGASEKLSHVFNVQYYPEVRLTHYENRLVLDEDTSERLEPGNG